MKALRIGMIGSGLMGKAHSIAYAAAPVFCDLPLSFQRAVVADVDATLASRAAETLGFDESVVGWQSVVERNDVDVIDIVAPNDVHEAIACAALRAGKHVFCEKPLATNVAAAERMAAAARKAGTVNMVGFNHRRAPAIVYARDLLGSGRLGNPLNITVRYFQDWALSPDVPFGWRFDRSRAGTGALGDIGSHAIECAEYLLGPIVRVCAELRTFIPFRPSENGSKVMVPVTDDDATIVLAEFESGVIGTIEAGRAASGRKNQLAFELYGSEGAVMFDWERRDELQVSLRDDPIALSGFRAILMGPEHPYGFWPIPAMGYGYIETFVAEFEELANAICEERQAEPNFEAGLRVQRVLEAVETSARERKWHDVSAP